jgi:alpha-tubulin suppressor-like RCC1 family protein
MHSYIVPKCNRSQANVPQIGNTLSSNSETAEIIRMARTHLSLKSFGFLLASASLVSFGCTPKNEPGSVHITMPASVTATAGKSDVSAQASGGNSWNTALNPATGPDLNCYAIFVSGSGLDSSSCEFSNAGATSTVKFGPFAGLISQGSETTIEVQPGSDRIIHVIGFRVATASDCTKNQLPGTFDESSLSEPFVIASQQAVIPSGPSTVTIQPVLNLQKKVLDCKLAGSTDNYGGGGSGTLTFGDSRDGKIRMQGSTPTSLVVGTSSFQSSPDVAYTPSSSGNLPATKLFGASRQVVNVDTTTGTVLTTGTAFTNSEFQAGDEVMFYVSAGNAPTAPDDPTTGACGSSLYRGSYGIRRISAVGPSTMTLNSAIASEPAKIRTANLAAATGSANFCRLSIHRVPSFEEIKVDAGATFNLRAAPYSPTTGTGGLVVLRTQRLEVNGIFDITASKTGYTGGAAGYAGTSVTGPGAFGSGSPNESGGGAGAQAGASGAGAGAGGSVASSPLGGLPLNFCENPVHTSIASTSSLSCATNTQGEATCWGDGSLYGNIGEGFPAARYSPTRVSNSLKFSSIAVASLHSCGIEAGTNALYCWGSNTDGQLGDGTTTDHYAPNIVNAGTGYRSVAAGGRTTCAVTTAGQLQCWGYGLSGQIGDSTLVGKTSPTSIDGANAYTSVSVGLDHACAVRSSTALVCWGTNTYGQVGDGTTTTRLEPSLIASTGIKSVAAGSGYSTCSLDSANTLKCWGKNLYGQLGDGSTTNRTTPTAVLSANTFSNVAVGFGHTCAVTTSNLALCWGLNANYQIGNGSNTSSSVPVLIDGSTSYTSIAPGTDHTCAVTSAGLIKCWGQGFYGQLGNGSTASWTTPGFTRQQQTCQPLSDKKVFLGGGGAGGQGASGGAGGGLVFVFAKEIVGNGSLSFTALGEDGASASAASGAGGGGTVAVTAQKVTLSSSTLISVTGGMGAFAAGPNSPGGGGGSIEMKYCSSLSSGLAYLSTYISGGPGQTGAWPGALGVSKLSDASELCSAN